VAGEIVASRRGGGRRWGPLPKGRKPRSQPHGRWNLRWQPRV